MLDSKHLELLSFMSNHLTPLTSKQLSNQLNKSVRTIKSYVKVVNDAYPHLITASTEGYLLDRTCYTEMLKEMDDFLPTTPEERIVYMIQLLVKEDRGLNILDIAYDLHVSESTIRADLVQLKKRLGKFDLEMRIENQRVYIHGLEKNKRRLLTSILYHESNRNFLNIESMQHSFKDYDLIKIKEIVEETLNQNHYFINDYALMNLILHIVVSINRIQHNNIYAHDTDNYPEINATELTIANAIASRINKLYQIHYSDSEIYELALLILSSGTNINYDTVNELNISNYITTEVLSLVDDLIRSINRYYYVDISENQFFVRFALHINNLLKRLAVGRANKNPVTINIKHNCPLIYDCAVSVSHEISRRYGVAINDDEIAYIAFHIGGALETQKSLGNKINCVLVLPQYYDMDQNLYNHIITTFNDSLIVKNVVTDETRIDVSDIDLIISTQNIHKQMPIPVLVISPFKNERDTNRIYDSIHDLRDSKNKNKFRETIQTMLSPKLFLVEDRNMTQIEALDQLIQTGVDHNCFKLSFKDEILAREHMSSTGYGRIAIPHSMQMNADKTAMTVLINKKPISWVNTDVELVIMLSIAKDDRKIFADIFDPLSMMLTENAVIDQLVQANDVETFINILTANYN